MHTMHCVRTNCMLSVFSCLCCGGKQLILCECTGYADCVCVLLLVSVSACVCTQAWCVSVKVFACANNYQWHLAHCRHGLLEECFLQLRASVRVETSRIGPNGLIPVRGREINHHYCDIPHPHSGHNIHVQCKTM